MQIFFVHSALDSRQTSGCPSCVVITQDWRRRLAVVDHEPIAGAIIEVMQQRTQIDLWLLIIGQQGQGKGRDRLLDRERIEMRFAAHFSAMNKDPVVGR